MKFVRLLLTKRIRLVIIALAPAWLFASNAGAATSNPYGGQPWPIPGIIEAEDFDTGGEGVAYHDVDGVNQGGQYRPSEGVDIGSSQDGAGSRYVVDWTTAGEWLQYTVDIKYTGTYNIIIREGLAENVSGNGVFHLELDGVDITGSQNTYHGVFWSEGYSTVKVPDVEITAGIHKLRLVMDSNSSDGVGLFNWILFELVSPEQEVIPVIYPTPNPDETYYVSPNGNDSASGTESQPWKTLAKAAESATAGQTIYVREGIYKERLVPENSGEEDNYIIFMAYPGEDVTIDGAGIDIPLLEGLVNLGSKKFIRISGFKVVNSGAEVANGKWNMGISAQKSHHIIIDNNYVEHTYSLGIDMGPASSYIVVDSNELTDTNFGPLDDEVSLGMFWFSHDIEIKNNKVHHTKNEGIGVAAGPHDISIHHNEVHNVGLGSQRIGIYIDAWTEHQYNIDVYSNRVHDNEGQGITAASEGGGLLENVAVYNNIVYNAGYDWGGIGLAPWSTTTSPTHPVRNVRFVNNTVYNCAGGGVVINNPEVKDVLVRNNILFKSGTGVRIDASVPSAELTIDHNMTSDPHLIDAEATNFRLLPSSPAIDAGSSQEAPGFDFDGKSRPMGDAFDVGAFEYDPLVYSNKILVPLIQSN